jgi:predicted AAA+ superfamily ATPase
MVDRPSELEALDRLLRNFPVVGIVGARQVGKTTQAHAFAGRAEKKVVYYDFDELVKSRKMPFSVIPAKAGIQLIQDVLDPGVRRGDGQRDFLRVHQFLVQRQIL